MNRLANTILQTSVGPAAGLAAPAVDLSIGGWNGHAPDWTEWLSNQLYIAKPLIPILLEGPKGFNYLRNPEKYLGILKVLVELRVKSVQGLNRTLEVETAETPIAGSGEVHEDVVNVTRQRSQISMQWDEVYGMPIATFFETWIRDLIMDPETKVANIFTQANKPTDQLADLYTMTMLFIEPDPTFTGVINAYLCTNMLPKSTGEITSRRDLTSPSEVRTHDIQWTSITQSGNGVKALAKKILTSMNITGSNPMNRPAFAQEISADVLALTKGYKGNMETLGQQAAQV